MVSTLKRQKNQHSPKQVKKQLKASSPALSHKSNASTSISVSLSNNFDSLIQTWLACGNFATTLGNVHHIAISSFESALKYDPSNLVALNGLVDSLIKKDLEAGNSVTGIQHSIEILNSSMTQFSPVKEDIKLWKKLAECYLLLNNNQKAHSLIATALEISNQDPSLWLLLGQTFNRLGMMRDTIDSLNNCLNFLPPNLVSVEDIDCARAVHAELASIAVSSGNIEMATNELNATLSLPPPPASRIDEYAALWCALAIAKERGGDLAGSISVCEDAEQRVRESSRIFVIHAYLLLIENIPQFNSSVAISLLLRAIEIEKAANPAIEETNEGDFLPWFLLGQAYLLNDEPQLSYDYLQIALKKAPSSPLPWLAIGTLYLKLNQLIDSLSAYSQVIKLQSSNKSVSDSLSSGTAWEGLSCVYERCDDQMKDATDSCIRASTCYRQCEFDELADRLEQYSKELMNAANGNSVSFRHPPSIPNLLIRDLISLTSAERIQLFNTHQQQYPASSTTAAATQQALSPPTQSQMTSPALSQQHPLYPSHDSAGPPQQQSLEQHPNPQSSATAPQVLPPQRLYQGPPNQSPPSQSPIATIPPHHVAQAQQQQQQLQQQHHQQQQRQQQQQQLQHQHQQQQHMHLQQQQQQPREAQPQHQRLQMQQKHDALHLQQQQHGAPQYPHTLMNRQPPPMPLQSPMMGPQGPVGPQGIMHVHQHHVPPPAHFNYY